MLSKTQPCPGRGITGSLAVKAGMQVQTMPIRLTQVDIFLLRLHIYLLQGKREKRNDKINVLKDLMAYRKNDVTSRIDLSMALNLIDVVFHEDEAILNAYHDYRDALLKQKDQDTLEDYFVKLVTFVVQDLKYSIADKNIRLCVGKEILSP